MTTKFWKRICADAEVDLDEYTVMDNYTRRERATFTAKMVESEWDFKVNRSRDILLLMLLS